MVSCRGLSQGSHENIIKSCSSRTTRGKKYLKSVLISSGDVAGKSNNRAISYKNHSVFQWIRKKLLARVACGNRLIKTIYKVLDEKVEFDTEKALGLLQQHEKSIQN